MSTHRPIGRKNFNVKVTFKVRGGVKMCYLHSLVLNVSTFIEMSEADPNDIDDIQDKQTLIDTRQV